LTQIKRYGCGIHLALGRPSITDHHAAFRRPTQAMPLPLLSCTSRSPWPERTWAWT